MALEIERKYLVNKVEWERSQKPAGHFYRQGYLSIDPERTVRVRVADSTGFITIKGLSRGATRTEYEYEIPLADAEALIDNFAVSELKKIRYKVKVADKLWEIDEFLGALQGLIIAEVELQNEAETFALPSWIGKEVTGEEKYYNVNLASKSNNKKQ